MFEDSCLSGDHTSVTDGKSFRHLFTGGSSVEHCAGFCPLGWRRSTGEVVRGPGEGMVWTDLMADALESTTLAIERFS